MGTMQKEIGQLTKNTLKNRSILKNHMKYFLEVKTTV